MERLLSDAEKLTGIHYDIDNYADIVEAIHAIQDEVGITGATSQEASSTIEGSTNSLAASWQNLLTDMGRTDADIDADVKQLCDNIGAYLGNLVPVAETAVRNMVNAISKLPGNVRDFFEEHKEEIKAAAENFFQKVADGVPHVIEIIKTEVPKIGTEVYTWFQEHKEEIAEKGKEFFSGLVDKLGEIKDNIFAGIKNIWESVKKKFGINDEYSLVDAGADWLSSLGDKAATAAQNIVKDLPKILTEIKFWLKVHATDIATAGINFLGALVTNTAKIIAAILEGLGKVVVSIVDELKKEETRKKIRDAGVALLTEIVGKAKEIKDKIGEKVEEVITKIKEIFGSKESLNKIKDAGAELIAKAGEAISEKKDEIVTKASSIVSGIKDTFENLVTYIKETFKQKWENAWDTVKDAFGNVFEKITEKAKAPINTVIGIINSAINGVQNAINAVIGGLNTISIDIPSWVPGLGGSRFGVNLNPVQFNQVPQLLAGGGVVPEGGTAIVGEYAPEMIRVMNGHAMVTPLNTGRFGGNNTNVVINVYPQQGQSEEEIARMVKARFDLWESQQDAVFNHQKQLASLNDALKREMAFA